MKPMLSAIALAVLLVATGARSEVQEACPEAQAAKGINAFAFDLYQHLRETDGNVFFSPYSISTAMTMAYAGSAGTTEQALRPGLRLPADRQQALQAIAALGMRFGARQADGSFELRAANSLWGQAGYPFHDDFLRIMREQFGSPLREVDYLRAAAEAAGEINGWVEEQTNQRIKNLIPEGALDAQTRLVLVNAIYFKGLWASQFQKQATADQPFEVAADRRVQVPMMYQCAHARYWENELVQALEMGYQGDEVSTLFILPRQRHGLAEVEKQLSPELIDRINANLAVVEVDIRLPRFKIEAEYELARQLAALGMDQAFGAKADFSRMTSAEELYISAVVHKAFVEVNEEGTEAAAATGVVMRALAMVEYPQFTADQPFLMLIRDTQTGAILFMGRVVEP